jgi:hypothetical protein
MMSMPESSRPDVPRQVLATDDAPDFATAVDRFTQTLKQFRHNELSEIECAALRSLLQELLRITRRGLISAVVMSAAAGPSANSLFSSLI